MTNQSKGEPQAEPVVPGRIGEDYGLPKVLRPNLKQPDLYEIVLSESDLMFIEDALVPKVNELRQQLAQCDHGHPLPVAVFLATSIGRLSNILMEARFMREHPDTPDC